MVVINNNTRKSAARRGSRGKGLLDLGFLPQARKADQPFEMEGDCLIFPINHIVKGFQNL